MLRSAKLIALAVLLLCGAALVAQTSSAKADSTVPYGESLVSYVGSSKLVASKQMSYELNCAADCDLVVNMRLVSGGITIPTVTLSGGLHAGGVFIHFNTSGPVLKKLLRNVKRGKSAKLVTDVAATDSSTGELDTDSRVFTIVPAHQPHRHKKHGSKR